MSTHNNSSQIQQRIFIVGAPRSGTTLLQGMLAAHPRIKSFPETHFFSMAYPKTRLKRWVTWPALNVQGVLERFLQEVGRPDLIPEVKIGLFDRDYEKSFIGILDRLTLEAGKDMWVEKTPRHLHFIPEIQKRVPGAKFIHIVRNGADVVASLYEVTNRAPREWTKGRLPGFHGYSIKECVKRWNTDVLITAKWASVSNHYVVRYEHLVETPTDILEEVCRFLQIKYSSSVENGHESFDQIVSPGETWKAINRKPLRRGSGKFHSVFSEEQKEYVSENLIQIEF